MYLNSNTCMYYSSEMHVLELWCMHVLERQTARILAIKAGGCLGGEAPQLSKVVWVAAGPPMTD